jgi:hypothetical protein
MKRVLPFLLFILFVVLPIVAGVVMTGPRATRVRAELARRGWRPAEYVEPGTESA